MVKMKSLKLAPALIITFFIYVNMAVANPVEIIETLRKPKHDDWRILVSLGRLGDDTLGRMRLDLKTMEFPSHTKTVVRASDVYVETVYVSQVGFKSFKEAHMHGVRMQHAGMTYIAIKPTMVTGTWSHD